MTPSPSSFLERLSDPERRALLSAGRLHRWSSQELLFREGDPVTGALVITSGVLKIHKHSPVGEELILALSGPGDLIGEFAAVDGATRSTDATALTDIEAVVFAAGDLRGLLGRHPHVSIALLELALARLRLADLRRLESATAESLPRVTSRLIELADRFGVTGDEGQVTVSMPINQEELASWAGASKESTARALRTLRGLGVIETHRRRLVVHDMSKLAMYSSSA